MGSSRRFSVDFPWKQSLRQCHSIRSTPSALRTWHWEDIALSTDLLLSIGLGRNCPVALWKRQLKMGGIFHPKWQVHQGKFHHEPLEKDVAPQVSPKRKLNNGAPYWWVGESAKPHHVQTYVPCKTKLGSWVVSVLPCLLYQQISTKCPFPSRQHTWTM